MHKRVSMLVALAVLLSLLLAACGNATSTPAPASTTAATSATTAATSATTAASSATTAAGAATGGWTHLTSAICSNPGAALTGEVKIGVGAPRAGASASLGLSIERGAEMAIEDINKCGGINGKKLVSVFRDDQAKADIGLTNFRELIENKEILALVGTANSAVGLVQAPVVNQSKIPWVIPIATGTKITQDTTATPNYAFRISMIDAEQTNYVAEYVLAKHKKIAIIHDDSGYGQGGKDDLLAAFTAKSVTPVSVDSYKVGWTADEMKPLLNKIKSGGAEAVISWGLGAENSNIRKAMKDLSVDLPIYGSWGLSMANYQQLSGGLENGTILPQTISVDTTNAKQKEFFDLYRKKYNTQDVNFPSGLAQSYDATWMVALAMRQPGGTDSREKLRENIANFAGYDGVLKRYEKPFSSKFEALNRSDFFMAVWKDGKIVRLEAK